MTPSMRQLKGLSFLLVSATFVRVLAQPQDARGPGNVKGAAQSGGACDTAETNCNAFLAVVEDRYPEEFMQAWDFHTDFKGDAYGSHLDGYLEFLRGGGYVGDGSPIRSPTVGMTLSCCLFAGECRDDFTTSKEPAQLTETLTTANRTVQLAWIIDALIEVSAMGLDDKGRGAKLAADMLECQAGSLAQDPCGERVAKHLRRAIAQGQHLAVGDAAASQLSALYLRRYAGVAFADGSKGGTQCTNAEAAQGNHSDAALAREVLQELRESEDAGFRHHAHEALQMLASLEMMWNRRRASERDKWLLSLGLPACLVCAGVGLVYWRCGIVAKAQAEKERKEGKKKKKGK